MNFRALFIVAIVAAISTAAFGQDMSDLTYTTGSEEALELYIAAQEKLDNFLADEAGELFARATQLDPNFAMAYYGWANSSTNLKDFEARLGMAVERVEKASEAEKLVILSLKAQNEGDVKLGEELLAQAVGLHPNGKRLRYMLGNFHFGQQKYDSAEQEYRNVIAIDPSFAPVYNILAYLLSNQGRYPEAIETLKKYAELRPKDNNPRDSMGEIYLYLGDHKNSLKEYGNSLNIDSSFVASWAGLGHNHVFRGDFARGRAMYGKITTYANTMADSNTSMFWTATAFCHEKKYDLALKTLEGQLEFVRARDNPSLEAVIHGQIAEIYRETGESEKAIRAAGMERQVAARPEISKGPREIFLRDAAFTEAVAFARMGMTDSVNSRLEEYRRSAAESTSPIVAGNLNTIEGIVAFYGKNYELALTMLSKANELDPIAMYYWALSNEAAGKPVEAEKGFAELGSMNRNSLSYGLVRPWAMAKAGKL
ncbi:MAG: hypothetical protein A2W25_10380 [candidate division Zixibacteria bacterium RBG_16_53_22]|nr:MAG: hypothetical protein A2W25_10380 [candidate division Zixibacteria bacterium RBG_16_53_22]